MSDHPTQAQSGLFNVWGSEYGLEEATEGAGILRMPPSPHHLTSGEHAGFLSPGGRLVAGERGAGHKTFVQWLGGVRPGPPQNGMDLAIAVGHLPPWAHLKPTPFQVEGGPAFREWLTERRNENQAIVLLEADRLEPKLLREVMSYLRGLCLEDTKAAVWVFSRGLAPLRSDDEASNLANVSRLYRLAHFGYEQGAKLLARHLGTEHPGYGDRELISRMLVWYTGGQPLLMTRCALHLAAIRTDDELFSAVESLPRWLLDTPPNHVQAWKRQLGELLAASPTAEEHLRAYASGLSLPAQQAPAADLDLYLAGWVGLVAAEPGSDLQRWGLLSRQHHVWATEVLRSIPTGHSTREER